MCYGRSIMTEANSSFVVTVKIMNCVTLSLASTTDKKEKKREKKRGKESFRQNKERRVCVCVCTTCSVCVCVCVYHL